MTEDHRKRIQHLAWQSKAIYSRKSVRELLLPCIQHCNDFEFVVEEQTQECGAKFWGMVNSLEEINVSGFDECFNLLHEQCWPGGGSCIFSF